VYGRFDPGYEHFERFVAAGEIVQTAVVVPIALALVLGGFEQYVPSLLGLSLLVALVKILTDADLTWYSNSPSGDYSALWYVSAKVPVAIMLGFVGTHLGVFYILA